MSGLLLWLLKSTAVLAAALLVTLAMRRASASARHAVWAVALVSLLVLPVLTHVLPRWDVAVLPPAPPPAPPRPLTAVAEVPPEPLWLDPAAFTETAEPAPPAAITRPTLRVDGGTWIAGLWLAGAVFGLVHFALGTLLIALKTARAAPVGDEAWSRRLHDAASRLGLSRPVSLRRSRDVGVPIVWGWRRPVILIPADADAWPDERRQAFLVHELAHVARHDCFTQTLASIAHSLYWPHPLAWWAMSCLRREAERACDDRVLAVGTKAPDYAHHLLEAARGLQKAPRGFAPASAVVERTSLGDRLLALLDDRLSRRTVNRRTLALSSVLAVLITAGIATMQPVARAAMAEAIRAAVAPAPAPPATPPAATAAASPRPRPLATAQPEPVLRGIVKGPDGKPVGKALVIAWEPQRGNEPPLTARTDAAGEFKIAVPGPSSYRLRVESPPLAPHTIDKTGTRGLIAVTMTKGATIEGIVRDGGSKRPIPRARVTAWPDGGPRPPAVPAEPDAGSAVATTDKDGRFRLEGLAGGPHQLSAAAAGYGTAERKTPSGATGVDLFLYPGASLSGIVKGADGKPVAGASILTEAIGFGSVPPTKTDDNGRFEIMGLTPGTYRILARHPQWAPAFLPEVSVALGASSPLELRLEKGHRVVGRLVGPQDRAVRGHIALQETDGVDVPRALNQQVRVKAGADGRFALEGLPPGTHGLGVFPVGYPPTRAEVAVGGREHVVDVGDIILEGGLVIRGKVRTASGAPVGGATLSTAGSGPALRVSAESDSQGAFALGVSEKRMYTINVNADGHAPLRDVRAEPGSAPLDLVLEPEGKVVGTVVDESGRPVSNCVVLVRSADNTRAGMPLPSLAAESPTPGGRFELRRISAGTYIVEVQAADHVDQTVSDVKVTTGKTTDVGKIVLSAGGIVRGVTVDGGGSPVPGATVTVREGRSVQFGSRARREATTDAAGRFELRGLPTGKGEVSARHKQYATSATVEVAIDPSTGPAEARLTLLAGGTVQGTARRRDGRPVTGAVVQITTSGVSFGPTMNAPVRSDGSFVVEHCAPGKAKAVLLAGTAGRYWDVLSKDIEVRDGDTTSVDLTLTDVLVSGRVTRAGRPVANHRVGFSSGGPTMMMSFGGSLVVPASTGPERLNGTTRADGSYELLVSTPGTYTVSVTSQGREKTSTQPFTGVNVPDAEAFTYDIALPDWALTGMAVDKKTREPIKGALVEARPGDRSPGGSGMSTEDDGRFRIAVEPGSYRVSAVAPKYVRFDETMDLRPGGGERTFELVRGGALKGHVRTTGGQGVDNAQVVALPAEGTAARSTRTLVDGSFTVDGLAAGSYELFVGHAQQGFARRPVVSFDEPSDLLLTPGVKMRLHFKDESGAPLTNTRVTVELIRVDGARVGIEQSGSYAAGRRLDSDPFEMVLPAGKVELVAWAPEKKMRGEVQLTVDPNAPEATMTLKPRR